MLINPESKEFPTIHISFVKKKFKCKAIKDNEGIIPDSHHILKDFMKKLNKNKTNCIMRYGSWSICLLPAFFISIVTLAVTG